MADTSIGDGGGSWSLLCCHGSNTNGSWKLERKPLSPSSHLPISPPCRCPAPPPPHPPPLGPNQHNPTRSQLARELEKWSLGSSAPFRGVGLELRDSRFTPETREQRIWSQKTWVLASVLPERMTCERLPNLPHRISVSSFTEGWWHHWPQKAAVKMNKVNICTIAL